MTEEELAEAHAAKLTEISRAISDRNIIITIFDINDDGEPYNVETSSNCSTELTMILMAMVIENMNKKRKMT
jgi:hypothetical protein